MELCNLSLAVVEVSMMTVLQKLVVGVFHAISCFPMLRMSSS
jgi:hypothetical protein